MIYLFTGSPGAGKTLSAIRFLLNEPSFKNRPVFVYGVRDCKIPNATVIEKEQVIDWISLPKGSVVLVDECQDIYRPRSQSSQVPQHLQDLEKHRHLGYDFIMTTQSPMLVDTNLRRLVYQHRHLERPFGLSKVRCLLWNECFNDPSDYHTRQKALTSTISLDKSIFGLYESAEIHTVKPTVPKRLYFFGLLAIVLIYFFSTFASGFGSHFRSDNKPQTLDNPSAIVSTVGGSLLPSKASAVLDYFGIREPRIAWLPHTAPVYDELTKPKTFPIPHCLAASDGSRCICHSQQGTVMDVPLNQCIKLATYGFFNDTIAPVETATAAPQGVGAQPPP